MKVFGIDEAGRGAVIGPLVVAGVLAEESEIRAVEPRDSKEISPERREEMYERILEAAEDWTVVKIPASEIDRLRLRKNLNLIEAEVMANMVRAVSASSFFLDSPQANTQRFAELIEKLSGKKVVADTFAEKKYPVVAAASVIAKVERDREMRKIEKAVGEELGTGYPHDQRTVEFLRKCAKKGGYPDFVRKSWVTASEILESVKQRSITDF